MHVCLTARQAPVAYMLEPALFTWRDVRVDVETEGRITRGMSVADWTGQSGRAPNARVLLGVDSLGFNRLFVSKVCRMRSLASKYIIHLPACCNATPATARTPTARASGRGAVALA